MPSYDVQTCADKCSRTLGCQGFNTYFERSPSKAPAPGCQDPPGSANPFCVLWGGPVTKDNALNEGQWREKYHVVITASNGYVLTSSVDPLSGKAINAPLDCNKNDAYMGMRLLTDNAPFDPQRCAAICEATTQYNIDHPEAGKAPRLCKFYNTYILNKNYISQGQACSMYTQYWDPNTYATNDGQWDGQGNHYTISSSTFFSNKTDIVTPVCPADIDKLKTNSDATSFCASYISYVAPTTATVTVGGGATTIEACGQPTGRISKRDESDPVLIEAVVGVFPSKVDNAAVTGTEPALETIPAQAATDAEALASATSAAIAQLEGTADAAISSATPAPSSTQGDAASNPTATDASNAESKPAATSSAPAQKRAASTPVALAGRDPIEISSACSKIVGSSTPTVTVIAAASTATTYRKCNNFPAKCPASSPARAFAGDFDGSAASVDDNVYTIVLPFQVCIYDICSTKVNPTSNGIISLAEYRNTGYVNDKGLPNFGGKAVSASHPLIFERPLTLSRYWPLYGKTCTSTRTRLSTCPSRHAATWASAPSPSTGGSAHSRTCRSSTDSRPPSTRTSPDVFCCGTLSSAIRAQEPRLALRAQGRPSVSALMLLREDRIANVGQLSRRLTRIRRLLPMVLLLFGTLFRSLGALLLRCNNL